MDDDYAEKDNKDKPEEEEEILDEEEEGFMQGYEKEEEVEECAECGMAIKEKKKVLREIEGEEYAFCSITCADEFEETMAQSEE
jgi:YHS domain-containing protein